MTSALSTWRTVKKPSRPPPPPCYSPPQSASKNILHLLRLPTAVTSRHHHHHHHHILSSTSASTLHTSHLLKMAESESSMMKVSCQHDCNGEAGFGSGDADYAEIIVIRHGETPWNSEGKIQGHLDVELNDVGRQQASAVADKLSKEPKISAVYTSDLKRALETAQIIAKSCGGVEVIEDQDLRERHLGDLQGLIYRELAQVSPKAYQAFVSHRTDQEIPGGGESLDQLYQRCTSALQRIGQKHKGERVVVVTHGGTMRALYKRASPNGRPGKVLNTSVNIFHLSDGDQWMIKNWGDVSHLDKTGFLQSGFGGDKHSG